MESISLFVNTALLFNAPVPLEIGKSGNRFSWWEDIAPLIGINCLANKNKLLEALKGTAVSPISIG